MTFSHCSAELFGGFISASCLQCSVLLFSRAFVRYSLSAVWDCDEHITLPALRLALSMEFFLMLSFIGDRQWSYGVLPNGAGSLAWLTIAALQPLLCPALRQQLPQSRVVRAHTLLANLSRNVCDVKPHWRHLLPAKSTHDWHTVMH